MNRMLAYMEQLKCVNEELMNEVSLTNKNQSAERKELEGYLSCLTDREKEIFIQMLQARQICRLQKGYAFQVEQLKTMFHLYMIKLV